MKLYYKSAQREILVGTFFSYFCVSNSANTTAMKVKSFVCILLMSISPLAFAQDFTARDSLRGGLAFERTTYDVLKYELDLYVFPDKKMISGANTITFKVVEDTDKIQIDLFENMVIDGVSSREFDKIETTRKHDAVYLHFPKVLTKDSIHSIRFSYYGNPTVAENAPWDGGFVWSKDSNAKDFVGVAVQGTGASLWYPCKDSQSDEPDWGAIITLNIPDGLVGVSNGRLLSSKKTENNFTAWTWEVKNPINSYNITLNIGDYVHFADKLAALDIDYYVLRENQAKAKIHFEADVKPMLSCFQEKFGAYPFIEDGYKLVETPFLGMEHQSAVAYGNRYKKGYLGNDLSGSGVGLLFDFIIIHETGHEWFGNSITSKDIADMWIHEGFTTYSESVFVECQYGYQKAMQYINGQRSLVQNQKPLVGQFGVNIKPSNSDVYYKAALMLNTLRHSINDDQKWWKLLLDYSNHFKHQIIVADDVIDFFEQESQLPLRPIFEQYIYHKELPLLEVVVFKDGFQYAWIADVADFEMPVELVLDDEIIRLHPKKEIQFYKASINPSTKLRVVTEKFFIQVKFKS